MARPDRTSTDAVAYLADLEQAPYRHGFFQALRKLEALHPARRRLGLTVRAQDDAVRLGQEPSVSFAPATLAAVQRQKRSGTPSLLVAFFGLFGPHGPLPLHLTEYARDRLLHAKDATFARFADIFHHRLLCLFYRAWADAEPTVHHDRPREDRFQDYVGATFGLATGALRERDAMPDYAKLYFAGHFSCQTRHPLGLEAMLGEFFEMPVRIEEFIGEWLEIPEDQRWLLGITERGGQIGGSATVGARVWSCQHKFRLVVGPIGLDDYRSLLPGERRLERLVAIVRNYIGYELAFDVQLVLKMVEVPALRLTRDGRLGWISWLGPRPPGLDADEVVIEADRLH
ncbi:MAG: type VI secretion system baseplate subunit TssG [Gammaproteobacteria bacterium]